MPVTINGASGVTTPGLASTTMPTSGGDPVVESGSNSDGEWTRWADGTQICMAKAASPNMSSQIGTTGIYSSNEDAPVVFPVLFDIAYVTPRITGIPREFTNTLFTSGTGNYTASTGYVRAVRIGSSFSSATNPEVTVIGRWK